MVTLLLNSSWPFVRTMVRPERAGVNEMVSPADAVEMACLREPEPVSAVLVTSSVAARDGEHGTRRKLNADITIVNRDNTDVRTREFLKRLIIVFGMDRAFGKLKAGSR